MVKSFSKPKTEDRETLSVIFPTFWNITPKVHKYYGGLEPRTAALVKYFAEDGYRVNVLAPKGSELNLKHVRVYTGNYGPFLGGTPVPYELEKDLVECNVDILKNSDAILEDNHFGYLRYLKSKDLDKFPLVANSWDHNPENVRTLPNFPQNVICVSKWTMSAMREKFKNMGHSFYHAYSGLILENYPDDIDLNDKQENLHLYLARFSGVKGADYVIRLAKMFQDDEFVLLGDCLFTNEPHYVREIKDVADELDNVTIVFNASYDEKIKYLRLANTLLHPGRWEEPLGWDMLEGLYFGAKVLAFDRGAVREIIKHDVHGYVLPFSSNENENVNMLERAFRRYKENHNKMSRENCHNRILTNFDFKRLSYPVYKEVLFNIKNTNPMI